MIEKKGEFYGGMGLMAAFILVLIIIFMPVFNGQNGLNYLDSLYNSISKGSAYYIPEMEKEIAPFSGSTVDVTLHLADKQQAEQTAKLFMQQGALVNVTGSALKVSGDLKQLLAACLEDADKMYANAGKEVVAKYGYDERLALFNWWTALKSLEKELKNQKQFKGAKVVALVSKKAVETAYNYYGIAPQKISDKLGVVIFSLIFYVIYTLWYGFAILFMFEGWGLKLAH